MPYLPKDAREARAYLRQLLRSEYLPEEFLAYMSDRVAVGLPDIPLSQMVGKHFLVPTGGIIPYAGATAPDRWLLCDGSAISRTTYADLFDVLGTAYGAGDGSTTFNVPDLRGRAPVGKGTHVDVDALGESDGVAVGSRTPGHTHSVTTTNHQHQVSVPVSANVSRTSGADATAGAQTIAATTDAAGGQTVTSGTTKTPYQVVNYIIKV